MHPVIVSLLNRLPIGDAAEQNQPANMKELFYMIINPYNIQQYLKSNSITKYSINKTIK